MGFASEEKEYRWFEAAKSYEQVLQSPEELSMSSAEVWGRIGYCYNLASRQAGDVEKFRNLRLKATEAYEKAATLFEANENSEGQAKRLECLALAEYERSWLIPTPHEKEKVLDKCRSLAKTA